jgi:hypothetical protein
MLMITSGQIKSPPCETEPAYQHESIQKIQDPDSDPDSTNNVHDLIITNNEPSVIIEVCPDEERSYVLPLAARVKITKTCTFKLINAPDVKGLIPLLNYTAITNSEVPDPILTTNDEDNLSVSISSEVTKVFNREVENVRQHFKEHSYIYIIVLVISVTMVLTCSTCCYLRPCPTLPRHRAVLDNEEENGLETVHYTTTEPTALPLLTTTFEVI